MRKYQSEQVLDPRRSEKGVGLVEMMIAVAVMSIVALGYATILANTQNSESMMQFHSDGDVVQTEVRALLSSVAACKSTFGFIAPVANTKYNITALNSDAGTAIYKVNDSKPYGNTSLYIDSMNISKFVASAVNSSKGEMLLQINLRPAKAKGGLIVRTMGISVELDAANKITACVPLAQMTDGIWQRIKPGLNDIVYIGPLASSAPPIPGKVGVGTSVPRWDFHVEGQGFVGTTAPAAAIGGANLNAFNVRGDVLFTDGSGNKLKFGDAPVWPNGYNTLVTPTNAIGFAHTDNSVYIGTFIGGTAGAKFGQFGTVSKHRLDLYAGNLTGLSLQPNTSPASIWAQWPMLVGGIASGAISAKQCALCAGNNIYTMGSFLTDHDVYAGGIVYANQAGPSDRRLKKDILPIEGSLEKILELRGVSYKWKDDVRGKGRQLGLIAQDVEEVFPEAVTTSNDGNKAIFYNSLLAPIVESIKSIYERLVAIETRLQNPPPASDELLIRLQKMENRIRKLELENAELRKRSER